ncbi:MAG: hypothetical protein HY554_07305 [Elusimicrobia bacterium]|nr:hypothetical protein [Elusimicrobiota bacterium]
MRVLALAALLAAGAFASEEHEDGGARTGQGKAVLEASAKQGLRLSAKALKRLGIKTQRLSGSGGYRVPLPALVYSAEEVGVYRLRDGWYKHVDVEISSKDRDSAVVRSGRLRAGDELVIAGAPLLRVAELDVLGGEEAGHDH